MNFKKILPLTFVSFLLIGCGKTKPTEIPGLVKKDVNVRMTSNFGEQIGENEYDDNCFYSDYWFVEDSYNLNYELALMSSMAGGASYSTAVDNNGGKIAKMLEDTGFSNIQKNQYYSQGVKLENSIGVIIGSKSIKNWRGKEYTLLAVFPRNAGYASEWAGNFNVGTSGIHKGFLEARDEMLRYMKSYISSHNITGDLKVWSSGYSRGAAVANLFGGFLAEDSGYFGSDVKISPNDVYVYTIGAPASITANATKAEALSVSGPRGEGYLDTNVSAYSYAGTGTINPTADQYKCIHNFVAVGDYVTKLPAATWGFTRYGVTESVNYGEEKMLEYLEVLSPETALKFQSGKNFATQTSLQTFDLEKFELSNLNKKMSADEIISERINVLMGIAGSREDTIKAGYIDVLRDVAAIFGTDYSNFANLVSTDVGSLIKVAVLSYLAYALDGRDVTESQGIAGIVMDLLTLFGKKVDNRSNYTDQQLLADLMDYLINDYQTNEVAAVRSQRIAALIPAPYNAVYTGLLEYAKAHNMTPRTVEGIVELVANYVNDNKENETIDSLLGLVAGLIPNEYISYIGFVTGKTYDPNDYESEEAMNKAIVLDLLICLACGLYDEDGTIIATAQNLRGVLLSLVGSLALGDYPKLNALLTNGSYLYDELVTNEPAPIADLIEEILDLAMPKDEQGNRVKIADAANAAIVELLDSCRSDANGKYVDDLKEKPEEIRKILTTLLFNPGSEYNLSNDLANALNLINTISFILPAHYHEMYICYLKTKIPAKKA